MMSKTLITNFTEGPITRQLVKFSLPFMLSSALQTVYSMVDMLIVGRYCGSIGLSAVSTASGLVFMMTAIGMGFSSAGQILVAQIIGASGRDGKGMERRALSEAIGTTVSMSLILGAIVSVILCFFGPALLRLLNIPAESTADGRAYLYICGAFTVFSFGYNVTSAILRGLGDSKRPLLFVFISSVMNILLDLLFVGALHMGTAGAAWATILSQCASFLFAAFYLVRRKEQIGFDFRIRSFAIKRGPALVILKLGIPNAIQMSAVHISMLFVNSLVNSFGVAASAVFGVGNKVSHIPEILSRSLSMAGGTMIGQNIAAGRHDRVKKIVLIALFVNTVVFAVFAAVFGLFPRETFGVFTTDSEVLNLASLYISALLISYPAYILMIPTQALINGVGFANFTLVVGLLDGFVFRIGLSYLLGRVCGLGIWGLFLGYFLAAYASAIPNTVYYLSGLWKRRRLLVK